MTKWIRFKKSKIVVGSEENTVEKGETVAFQHFLLFLQCFQMFS